MIIGKQPIKRTLALIEEIRKLHDKEGFTYRQISDKIGFSERYLLALVAYDKKKGASK